MSASSAEFVGEKRVSVGQNEYGSSSLFGSFVSTHLMHVSAAADPRHVDLQLLAQIQCGSVDSHSLHCGPQLQRATGRPTHEALIHVLLQIYRERPAAARPRAMHRTRSAELAPGRFQGTPTEQIQDLSHGNLRPNRSEVDPWHAAASGSRSAYAASALTWERPGTEKRNRTGILHRKSLSVKGRHNPGNQGLWLVLSPKTTHEFCGRAPLFSAKRLMDPPKGCRRWS